MTPELSANCEVIHLEHAESETTQRDQLASWHTLQGLAGLR